MTFSSIQAHWYSDFVSLMCSYLCVLSTCSLVIKLYLWFFYPLKWKSLRREKKMYLTSLCCVPETAYLFDAWLILTFALKLSVIVCVHDLHFVLQLPSRENGFWLLPALFISAQLNMPLVLSNAERLFKEKSTMLNKLASYE